MIGTRHPWLVGQRTGTDVAIEACDITLERGDLRAAAEAIRRSRRAPRIIKGNLFGRSPTTWQPCPWQQQDCSTRCSPELQWHSAQCSCSEPVLFQASYYDKEQGLTDAEVFAARVHDFHEFRDRWNRNHAANNSPWRTGDGTWSDDRGPEPASCPACGAAVRSHGL
jgi:hypothetical protein